MKILILLTVMTFSAFTQAESHNAYELFTNVSPKNKKALQQDLHKQGIKVEDLKTIDIDVDPHTKTIDVASVDNVKKKHALFLAVRLGFPLLAGIGVIYKNQGTIPFNVTLNFQTVILASSYNASIAWNFYKGFFVGVVGHYIKSTNIFGGGYQESVLAGPQIGYQHAFGKTQRFYVDGRVQLMIDKDRVIPDANLGFGVRFW